MLKRTPLYERHVALGARLIDFGGWEMPVRYTSEREEHLAVRQSVGIFDVSHMGEVFLEGVGALDAAQRLFTHDLTSIVDGQALYAGLLNERGTFVDDCVVYRYSPEKLLVCVNASNRETDFAWIAGTVEREFAGRVTARDESDRWAQIAVQGPKAADVVAMLAGPGVRDVQGYHFRTGRIRVTNDGAEREVDAILARTGYTGEDGFEIYVASEHGAALWDALRDAGKPLGLLPCGLAARDTLRLEAGMALYGNDIDDEHTPLEAGLGWIVKLDKPMAGAAGFIGADALRRQKIEGVKRRLRGLEMEGRGIPRHGYRVLSKEGEPIGVVTSGTHAPFLGRPIAMAYLDEPHAALDHEVAVEVRGAPVPARVVKLPFYRRART